jgi:hypothetical protein
MGCLHLPVGNRETQDTGESRPIDCGFCRARIILPRGRPVYTFKMFVAVARIPSDPAAHRRAAEITGLAMADVSRLLAGTLPRVLVRATEEGGRIVDALEQDGFVAFTGEASSILREKDRVVARNLELRPGMLAAVDGRGRWHECPFPSITAFLPGVRAVETAEIVRTTERKLALGKALLTGGLAVTKKVETVSERTTSAKESFILIQCGRTQPAIMLYERRLNYQCLGADLQPSTHGNQVALLASLRAMAPAVPLDDRLGRAGFLAGLPPMSIDPVDLAVFLVSEARARGC